MPPFLHKELPPPDIVQMVPTKQLVATFQPSITRKADIIEDEPIPAVRKPTNRYPDSDDNRASTIVAIILLGCFVVSMLVATIYFLIFHKQKSLQQLEKSPTPRITANQASWKIWPRKRAIPQELIIHRGRGGIIHCREPLPSDLRGILMPSSTSPLQPKESQSNEATDLDPPRKSLSRFRLPSLRFTQEFAGSVAHPVPATTSKAPSPRFAFQRRAYLLNNRVSIVISDTADSSVHTEDTYDKNLAQDEESISNSHYNRSSGSLMQLYGSNERNFPNVGSQQDTSVNCDIASALQTPDLTIASTSSGNSRVSRSFTAPAAYVFQQVGGTEKPDESSTESASLTSNLVLRLVNEVGTSLLEEDLPPPAIMVSPPTASSLHRRSLANVSPRDVWSPRYRNPSLSNTVSPPEYSPKIRHHDLLSPPPPRPPRSPKRTSVQLNNVE